MRINKISIRGFTTFKDIQVLDLAALGPGLIAIAGPNGAGKSTALEAIPGAIYRQAPSRGNIADLATSRESTIEVVGENGDPFRILLSVDAHNGKSEALLFDGAGEPIAGPKVRDFDRIIAERFAPLSVYLAAAFSCQTGAGSLMKMERAERRELFGRLLGLDHLEDLAGAARERARQVEAELAGIRTALETVKEGAVDIGDLEAALVEAREKLRRADALVGEAKKAAAAAAAEYDRGVDARIEVAKAEKSVHDAYGRANGLVIEAGRIRAALAKFDEILRDADSIRKIGTEISELEGELESKRAAGETASLEERLAQAQNLKLEREAIGAAAAYRASVLASENSIERLAEMRKQFKHALESTAAVPCAGALPDEARAACSALTGHFRTRDAAQKTIAELEAGEPARKESTAASRLKMEDAAEDSFKAAETAKTARAKVEDLRAGYRRVADKLVPLRARDRRSELDRAEGEAKGLRERLQSAELAANEAVRAADRVAAECPKYDEDRFLKTGEAVHTTEAAYDDAYRLAEEAQWEAAKLEVQIETAKASEAKALELSGRLRPLEQDLADWRYLARGLGREGVQALELDAAGPRVSELTNELLADAYGSRFQVRLDTQAAKADGKGVKETFDIVVVDNERGREGSGEDLSGGEKVIVGEALGLAVGLFHAQASGINLGTVCRDETVGALDPENAERYLAMLRSFIRVGQVYQLLMVCHSPSLLDLADVIIHVDNGKISVEA